MGWESESWKNCGVSGAEIVGCELRGVSCGVSVVG